MESIKTVLRDKLLPFRQDNLFNVVFFLVLFLPLFFSNYLVDSFEAPKIFLYYAGIAVGLLVWLSRTKQTIKTNRRIIVLFSLFLGWVVISTAFSLDKLNSLFGLYGRYTGGLLFNFGWVVFVFLCLVVLTQERLKYLFQVIVLASWLVGLMGILQTYEIGYYGGIPTSLRLLAPSTLGNPNFSAMFIVGILPLALTLLFLAKSLGAKIYYAVAAFIVAWAVILFTSRGSILALFAELGVFLLLMLIAKSWRSVLALLLTFLVSGSLFLGFYNLQRPDTIGQTLQLREHTVSDRFLAWGESLALVAQKPLVGTGPGNFYIGFKSTGNVALGEGERFDDAHNIFLQQAVTGGIPFLLFFLAIIFVAIRSGWQDYWRTKDPLIAAVLSGLVGLLISASFNPVVIAGWVLLGLFLAALLLPRVTNHEFALPRSVKIFTATVAVVLLLWSVGFMASEYLTFQTVQSYRFHTYSSAMKFGRAALVTNPLNNSAADYWAAARIKSGQSPELSAKLIEATLRQHPKSSGTYQTAYELYYLLYQQTRNEAYKQRSYELIETALELEPNYSGLVGNAAYIYYRFGNLDRALKYARQSVILNSNQFYSWILLAEINQKQGHRQGLIYAYEQAYKLSADSVLLKKSLEEIKKQMDITQVHLPVAFPEPDI